ncbi:MAG: hypothetical protein K940chlam7_00920 [Chlamydiae bacterium]|nr:hypothetical protein [Chlamydiota bacterium]
MVYSNGFSVGDLTPLQYSQLMSPPRNERDKNGDLTDRNITWIRHTFNHVIMFIHRLFHAIFKDHQWKNDQTLLNKFQAGLEEIGKNITQETFDQVHRLAKELILRNPKISTREINNKLEVYNKSILQGPDCKKRQIGRKDTEKIKWQRKVKQNSGQQILKDTETENAKKRQEEIDNTRELYRPQVVDDEKKNPERHCLIKKCVEDGELRPSSEGVGCLYYLKYGGNPMYMVKPHGENTFCLHNRKLQGGTSLSTDTNDNIIRVRKSIPLYFESLSEILFYRVAKLLELQAYVPETFPVIINSNKFYVKSSRKKIRIGTTRSQSSNPKEKFCSAQQYVKNQDRLHEWNNDPEKKIKDINNVSVEANIFLDMLCGNTDRFSKNCLVDEDNKLINIDNGLCFPERNDEIRCCTLLLPQAEEKFHPDFIELISRLSDEKDPLSKELFHLIENAQRKHADVNLRSNDSDPATYTNNVITALRDRIEIMKWAVDQKLTMQEAGLRVFALRFGTDYAKREDPFTRYDVAPFHLSIGNNSEKWPNPPPPKQETSREPEIEEQKEEVSPPLTGSDSDSIKTFVVHDQVPLQN